MTAPQHVSCIADTDVGEYVVFTERSVYAFNMKDRTVTRQPATDDGYPSDLRLDGEPIPLVTFERLEVGAEAVLVLRIRTDGMLTFRRTSLVTSIEQLAAV